MGVFDKKKMMVEVESYSEFANLLTKARKFRGFTQDELAKEIGKSRASIANYEIGKSLPPLPEFVDICKVLNVKPNELLGYAPLSLLLIRSGATETNIDLRDKDVPPGAQ